MPQEFAHGAKIDTEHYQSTGEGMAIAMPCIVFAPCPLNSSEESDKTNDIALDFESSVPSCKYGDPKNASTMYCANAGANSEYGTSCFSALQARPENASAVA
jgi:hypothetical protein